jgi:hypothetical protein
MPDTYIRTTFALRIGLGIGNGNGLIIRFLSHEDSRDDAGPNFVAKFERELHRW